MWGKRCFASRVVLQRETMMMLVTECIFVRVSYYLLRPFSTPAHFAAAAAAPTSYERPLPPLQSMAMDSSPAPAPPLPTKDSGTSWSGLPPAAPSAPAKFAVEAKWVT